MASYNFGRWLGDVATDWFASGANDRQFNAEQAELTREFNSAEAQKDRDFQKYMASSAHQLEVADMKAAGLNPILSVSGGNGASTPSGATASSSSASSRYGNSSLPSLINSSANLVKSFNSDNNKKNDLDIQSAVKLVSTLANMMR